MRGSTRSDAASRGLAHLTRAGIVERRTHGREVEYVLTPAGRELAPVVEALGIWGVRWAGKPVGNDYDPKLLMWDMHRNVDHAAVPAERTVLHFRFPELPGRGALWWMTLTPQDADVCDYDPGHDIAVTVTASVQSLTEIWMGNLTWRAAQRGGGVEIAGPSALRRAVPSWFTLAPAAVVPRPARVG